MHSEGHRTHVFHGGEDVGAKAYSVNVNAPGQQFRRGVTGFFHASKRTTPSAGRKPMQNGFAATTRAISADISVSSEIVRPANDVAPSRIFCPEMSIGPLHRARRPRDTQDGVKKTFTYFCPASLENTLNTVILAPKYANKGKSLQKQRFSFSKWCRFGQEPAPILSESAVNYLLRPRKNSGEVKERTPCLAQVRS